MSSPYTDSIAALLSTLSKSFRTVPSAATPALLDCILASTGASPSLLFDYLLVDFKDFIKDMAVSNEELGTEKSRSILPSFNALCHLLKKIGDVEVSLKSFIWKAFVPLMKMLQFHESGTMNEIMESFNKLLVETNSWRVIEATLAPFLLKSVGLSLDIKQDKFTGADEGGSESDIQGFGCQTCEVDVHQNNILLPPRPLSLTVSCRILTNLLEASLQSGHKVGSTSQNFSANELSAVQFWQNLFRDMCDKTIQMLSQSLDHRSCAVSLVLPTIFKAFSSQPFFEVPVCGETLKISRNAFFMQTWKCCRVLFAMGLMEKRDAFGIISLYLSFFPLIELSEDADKDNGVDIWDIRAEKELWEEIKKGLVEKESFMRKQSVYILKKLLCINEDRELNLVVPEKKCCQNGSVSHSRTKRDLWAEKEARSLGIEKLSITVDSCLNRWLTWEAFLILYEMLEEYGAHLVEAAWSHKVNCLFLSVICG
ncbi:hypothetical protein Dimus_008034 [Dionaea muscipula]